MTKKNYIEFAAMFKSFWNMQSSIPGQFAIIKTMAEGAADIFENDNPNFDREKFLKECGF